MSHAASEDEDGGADRPAMVGSPPAVVNLTTGIGVLSLVTGIVYIGSPAVLPPLDPYLPDQVRTIAGFTGTFTGFLLLTGALALRSRLRVGWYATMLLLPVSAFQGVIQSSPASIPLIVLSLAAMPFVYRQRRAFDRKTSLGDSQIAAGTALAGVLAYGTVGSFALRRQFRSIDTLLDAFYYTVVTATTVGYGDAVPETQVARLFGLTIVSLGTISFVLAAGALLGPLLESRFKAALGKMTTRELDRLDDHVLILGYGDLTETILEDLEGRIPVLVVTEDPDAATFLPDRGVDVLVEDPRDEAALERANVDRAHAVVAATNSDGDDALSVLTARRANPDAYIVAAATNRENTGKLRDAGADTVVSPMALGGKLLADSAVDLTPIDDVEIVPAESRGRAAEG